MKTRFNRFFKKDMLCMAIGVSVIGTFLSIGAIVGIMGVAA